MTQVTGDNRTWRLHYQCCQHLGWPSAPGAELDTLDNRLAQVRRYRALNPGWQKARFCLINVDTMQEWIMYKWGNVNVTAPGHDAVAYERNAEYGWSVVCAIREAPNLLWKVGANWETGQLEKQLAKVTSAVARGGVWESARYFVTNLETMEGVEIGRWGDEKRLTSAAEYDIIRS